MESAAKQRVLIVDDERQITRVLRMALESHGYEVRTAQDGLEALAHLPAFRPDLIISDLAMPNMDGVELTRAVRAQSVTPIIVLSVREQDATKVQALDAGANDYMTKPFSTPELLARVRVQLRQRLQPHDLAAPAQWSEGDFHLDTDAHRVQVRGAEIHLTPREFELLVLLAQNTGRVLTHKTILRAIWGPGDHLPDNLRVLVAALRRKIDLPDTPSYIENEPWIGYRFRAVTVPDRDLSS